MTRVVLLGICLMIAACVPEKVYDSGPFPVLEGNPPTIGMRYSVCTGTEGERIYMSARCGDDTCWIKYYNGNGELIEETPEVGPGTPSQYRIRTQVRDCARTTEKFFRSKVKE